MLQEEDSLVQAPIEDLRALFGCNVSKISRLECERTRREGEEKKGDRF